MLGCRTESGTTAGIETDPQNADDALGPGRQCRVSIGIAGIGGPRRTVETAGESISSVYRCL